MKKQIKNYSTIPVLNDLNLIPIIPIHSYLNIDIEKKQICKDNRGKTGIYRLTHVMSKKSYVGSSINLSIRFGNYFNINYLKREIEKNNSKIYRALLKYGYSSFKLDILEYCDSAILIEREQYYLDNLKLEYNTLKTAGSFYGFKHSIETIERMRLAKLGRKRDEVTKLKLSANSQAYPIRAINNNTGETKLFTSVRKTANFIGIHHSYLAKCLKIKKFYTGRGYYITKIIL
jgi:hypothetical protein